jgi:hypothetical protein
MPPAFLSQQAAMSVRAARNPARLHQWIFAKIHLFKTSAAFCKLASSSAA